LKSFFKKFSIFFQNDIFFKHFFEASFFDVLMMC
jgi:hypothetical protein